MNLLLLAGLFLKVRKGDKSCQTRNSNFKQTFQLFSFSPFFLLFFKPDYHPFGEITCLHAVCFSLWLNTYRSFGIDFYRPLWSYFICEFGQRCNTTTSIENRWANPETSILVRSGLGRSCRSRFIEEGFISQVQEYRTFSIIREIPTCSNIWLLIESRQNLKSRLFLVNNVLSPETHHSTVLGNISSNFFIIGIKLT